MNITREFLVNTYTQELERCYQEVDRLLDATKYNRVVTRKVYDIPKDLLPVFLVEIVNPLITNSDDYGIVIDITLEEGMDAIICNMDVLTSSGSAYHHNHVEISLNNEEAGLSAVNETLAYMKQVPALAVAAYLKDFNNYSSTI